MLLMEQNKRYLIVRYHYLKMMWRTKEARRQEMSHIPTRQLPLAQCFHQ
jgi:hypothetical protein